jgi:hypothetical protein
MDARGMGAAMSFNSVKVFSATTATDRENLGERVSQWLEAHKSCEVVDRVVTQSSDDAYHCIAITLFYNEPSPAA